MPSGLLYGFRSVSSAATDCVVADCMHDQQIVLVHERGEAREGSPGVARKEKAHLFACRFRPSANNIKTPAPSLKSSSVTDIPK